MKKKCAKCQLVKELAEFYVNRTAFDGRTSSCKECEKIYNRKLREKKKEDRIYAF